jgi:signal transduction histidine kinase
VKRVGFRGRLFLILLGFAVVPSILISLAWSATGSFVLPLAGATAAWDSVAITGERAIAAARAADLTDAQRGALQRHDSTLRQSVLQSRRAGFLFREAARKLAFASLFVVLIIGVIASRVAGHLSRNLSRPLQELVGWTERIGRAEPLPTTPPRRGAPEFEVLRRRMRIMAGELELGRARALEAERAATLRESARQVAHELKNPLTPIRFAIARLRREAPETLRETIDVLEAESLRLEHMAKSFAQFGRLPEGPRAPVDLGELVRSVARNAVPQERPLAIDVADDVPMIPGHVDALGRALTNVLLNAVEASPPGAQIALRVQRTHRDGRSMVEVAVRDNGSGIPANRIERIWEPYVTHKAGGTGLGLAIVRQTLLAHDGFVEVESAPGLGTTMRLLLPADAPASDSRGENGR